MPWFIVWLECSLKRATLWCIHIYRNAHVHICISVHMQCMNEFKCIYNVKYVIYVSMHTYVCMLCIYECTLQKLFRYTALMPTPCTYHCHIFEWWPYLFLTLIQYSAWVLHHTGAGDMYTPSSCSFRLLRVTVSHICEWPFLQKWHFSYFFSGFAVSLDVMTP